MAALAATLIGLACGGSGGSSSGSRNFGAKLSASSLTFASQGVSTTSGSQSVSVTNTGILDLSFSAITITGANAAAFAIGTNTCKGADILPSTSCTIAVTFTPSSTGSLTATLDITDNAPDSPQTVTLNGTGSGPLLSLSATGLTGAQPAATPSTGSLSFTGEPIGGSDSVVVTATNSGSTSLGISSVSVSGPNAAMFTKTADSCSGATLAAAANCTLTVTFKPTTGGTLGATLTFTDSAFNSPQTLSMSGVGLAPAVSISPNPLVFSDENLGTSSGNSTVTITNSGAENLIISTVTTAGANVGDFPVAGNTCNGATIVPNTSCLVNIQFVPAALGSRTASLVVTDNASDSPEILAISGVGTQPIATLSTASVTFSHQNQGSSSTPQLVTMSNTGTGPLTISAVALGGANPGAFATSADTCSGTVVQASGACTIRVGFSPAGSSIYTATLNFSDDAAATPQAVALTGTGTAPTATLSSPSLSFSSQNVGSTSAAQSVILSNTGTSILMVSATGVTGTNSTDFVTSDDTCTGATVMPGSNCSVSLVFKPSASGARSAALNFTDNAPGTSQSVTLGGTAVAPAISLTPASGSVALSGTLQFGAFAGGVATSAVTWSVNGTPGGSGTVGTISAGGLYTAPTTGAAQLVNVQATLTANTSLVATAAVAVIPPGTVTATANSQVALYTINVPEASKIYIQFGQDTNYGLTTWAQSTPAVGGQVQILVAGMLGNTEYHMRAVAQFLDGSQFTDMDQTFVTGALPAGQTPTMTATTTAGLTPNPGIEMLDLISEANTGTAQNILATDLSGNVIWYYPLTNLSYYANPIKILPDGNVILNLNTQGTDGMNSLLEEVTLAGDVVWSMNAAQLNAALANAGFNITTGGTHHDVAVLPNGHLLVIASETQNFTGLPGYPGTTAVVGDVIIDLDTNQKPVWVWSEFDHLDVNRHPMSFPDWTHTNAVLYSPSDGNIIISIRHQFWLIKIDYNNGQGSGDIVWKLGWQGDFTLEGGTDPVDWFYAQHGPSFDSPNTAGTFNLNLFDNGDNRLNEANGGQPCGAGPQSPCYSSVPLFQINETALTATIEWQDKLNMFSFFGGNAEILANGNSEFDECASGGVTPAASAYEVTQDTVPQTVWQLQIGGGQYAYRVMRLPSLYPGVQW